MRNTLTTITTAALLLTFITSVQAQTVTISPTESIRDSVKKQVDQELSQIKKSVAKKGYVGTISSKSDGNITLTNLNNQSRTITVTADATIKLSGGKDGTPADLKVGDFILAMGDVDSAGAMTVKRLLVTSVPTPNKRLTIFGNVSKVTSSTITLETSDKKSYSIKLQSSTKYFGTVKASEIKVDTKIMVIGTSTSDYAATAKNIYLFQ